MAKSGSKKNTGVEKVALQCAKCNRKNYTTFRNKRNMQGKLEVKKYCKWDREHTIHKETKIK
jgi:large subunit ribosomal protein L33